MLSLWRDWRVYFIGLELDHFFPSIEVKMTQIKRKHQKKCDKQNELEYSLGDFQLLWNSVKEQRLRDHLFSWS